MNSQGQKELLALEDGFRESEEPWLKNIHHLKKLGLRNGPKVELGGGALEFWAAIRGVFPQTRTQRCSLH